MEPLIVLVVVTLAVRAAGMARFSRLRPWRIALRGGLAAMFFMTGVVHFVGMRAEMIEMVPPALPAPELLVTVTGVLELLGGVGLLWSRTAPWAAGGLALMLVAMFPANVYAAVSGLTSDPMEALLPRTLIQIVFLAATLAVAVPCFRDRRRIGRDAVRRSREKVIVNS